MEDQLDVVDSKGGEEFNLGDVSVKTAQVNHTIHTLAYRFEHENFGSIVISGDLSYSPSLVELARNADILVIDSGGMPSLDGPRRRGNGARDGGGQSRENRDNADKKKPQQRAAKETGKSQWRREKQVRATRCTQDRRSAPQKMTSSVRMRVWKMWPRWPHKQRSRPWYSHIQV